MKSLDQDSLLSIGSWTVAWWIVERGEGVEGNGFGYLRALEGLWVSGVVVGDGYLVFISCARFASTISAAGARDGAVVTTVCFAVDCSIVALAITVLSVTTPLDLKNPIRLCWPFPFALGAGAAEPDFTRLSGLDVDVSELDRLPIAGDREINVSEALDA